MLDTAEKYSIRHRENQQALRRGVRDGIPIGLGYFAVAFSLGIMARTAGLTPGQGFLASLLCNASAGEYAAFTLIAAGGTYLEMALITLITNARYLLMGCALSQRIEPTIPFRHRLLVAFGITDEIFGISVSRPGHLNPYYNYGAILFASPCWATGTALGILAGNLMPGRVVSAFSVALYGMFLAVIIPAGKQSRVVAGVIAVSFALSWAAANLPALAGMSGGSRTILLTLVISGAAALLFPRKEEDEA